MRFHNRQLGTKMNRKYYKNKGNYLPIIDRLDYERWKNDHVFRRKGQVTPGNIGDQNKRTNFNKWCNLPDAAKRLYWLTQK